MSSRTIYKCDRCGKEQETDDQFWTVGFIVTNRRYQYTYRLTDPNFDHKREWCRNCVEEFGLLPRAITPQNPEPIPLSLEDMLREIIREEIETNRAALQAVQS
jgi:hypothetical protein